MGGRLTGLPRRLLRNQQATQVSEETGNGLVTVIFPDIVATAKYDSTKGHWVIEAPGGDPFDLEQTDPMVTDEVLRHEITSYPVQYMAVIDRSHLPDPAQAKA